MSLLKRFRLVEKLGRGSFGDIYKGIDKQTNEAVAMKIESKIEKKGLEGQLKQENIIYKELRNVKINPNLYWPQVKLFGTNGKGQSVLIMDLLGPDLDALLNLEILNHSQVRHYAVKMIHLLEIFHGKGYVHRDLKPQNFCLHLKDKSEIFLIDYGLAKKYCVDGKTHIPYSQKRSLKGTVRYASLNTHLSVEQSRRDDLISLAYIIVFMVKGSLPWQHKPKNHENESKEEMYSRVMVKKMACTFEELTQDILEPLRTNLMTFLFYVNSLLFEEKPDYKFCKSLFIMEN